MSQVVYRERAAQYQDEANQLAVHDRRLSAGRGAVFLAAVATFMLGAASGPARTSWYVAGGTLVVILVILAMAHESLRALMQQKQRLQRVNDQLLARLERQFDRVSLKRVAIAPHARAIAKDLDLFGKGSLFHWLCLANTTMGIETLRDWLLVPAEPAELAARHASIRQLRERLAEREELMLHGQTLEGSFSDPGQFIAWAEGERWLHQRPWLTWLSRAAVLVLAGLLIGTVAGRSGVLPGLDFSLALALLGGLCIVNIVISVRFLPPVRDIFNSVSSKHHEAEKYSRLFQLLSEQTVTAQQLSKLCSAVTDQDGGAVYALKRLARITACGGHRQVSLMFIIYVIGQMLLLWDFHVLAWLERWQTRFGGQVREWFTALGQFEALASLSTVSYEHPEWSFPIVDSAATRIKAVGIGHPMLPDDARVANNVEVGPAGSFLLVTGSNMSGKSTLLRSIGVNVLLAQAGSPVCAKRLYLPPTVVTTSMRIQDSLEDGVSFFMAELKRLKEIVDQADRFKPPTAAEPARAPDPGLADQRQPDTLAAGDNASTSWHLLYLLDEILQGTNSRERHVAVARVLEHLLASGAIGAVTTHDLDLAKHPRLAGSCQAVHFRETLLTTAGQRQMTFDYLLREGVATTTNALALLEMVGLSEHDAAGPLAGQSGATNSGPIPSGPAPSDS